MGFLVRCTCCNTSINTSTYRVRCDMCDGLLEVEYDSPPLVTDRIISGLTGLARYAPMLPIHKPSDMVTMGEGDTPIIPLTKLGSQLGLDCLYGKLEYLNPTGSFKDRGNAVQVTVLKEAGINTIGEPSAGNAGNSTAAYCARAGIKYIGFADEEIRDRKSEAMTFHGAELHWIKGNRRTRRSAAEKFCKDTGILFFDYANNPYFTEGQKTIAYEIVEQMDTVPQHIIVPAGLGSIILGLWKGFKEMAEDGRIKQIPRLYGAQTELFQPLVAAYNESVWNHPPDHIKSVAVGIRNSEVPRLKTVVQAMRDTGGQPVAVPEKAIISWQKMLAQQEGIFIEPTSATALAALESLVSQQIILGTDTILVPLTGAGIKEPIPHT